MEKTKSDKDRYYKIYKNISGFFDYAYFCILYPFFFPDEVISNYLGHSSKSISVCLASFFGSITIMAGFIAFPLSGILLTKGVPYVVLSAFTTTLMIVGILTYPIEKKYFGQK